MYGMESEVEYDIAFINCCPVSASAWCVLKASYIPLHYFPGIMLVYGGRAVP